MKIQHKIEDDFTLIIPFGRIDGTTSEQFRNYLLEHADFGKDILVDMRECIYISSSGLRVFLEMKKRLNDRRLRVKNANDTILEVFELTGFDQYLDIEKSLSIDGKDIKVLFFDIDGTLLSHSTGSIPKSTIQAIKRAQEKGIKVVIATGRDLVELKKLPLFEIEFDGYLTLNGNICYDANENIFDGNAIIPEEIDILVNIFKAGKIPFVLQNAHKRYINFVNDLVVKVQNETHGTIPEIDEYKGEEIYQCNAFCDKKVRRQLDDLLDHCEITAWNEYGIDIIAKTGGKDAGIIKYLEYAGYSRSQSMCFGDGENDQSMITFCGIGVAMGNGNEKLKQAADYITTHVDDNGIANALIHFGIVDKESIEL